MITMIVSGVRNEYFEGYIGVDAKVVFTRKTVFDPNRHYPYQVGHNGQLESFMSYDGARSHIMMLVKREFDRLNTIELEQEVAAGLERFMDEISPPA